MSTFNRAEMLPRAIECLAAQQTSVSYEVIIVDNNSTDATRVVLEGASRRYPHRLRCGFEGRQGVSYGRNRGIELSRGPIVAFTDDDVLVSPQWIETIVRALEAHREVDCVGGRVLPIWSVPPPAWLTPRHWSPLALVDYGDEPFYVDRQRPVCLVTANVAYRRAALDAIGWFSPAFRRAQDHELLLRLWDSGRRALYQPSLVVTCEVPATRLSWAYHRRWHTEHGRFSALMPDHPGGQVGSTPEGTPRTLFGAPAAIYRELASSAASYVVAQIARRDVAARHAEACARDRASFIAARARMWRREGHGAVREILRFASAWVHQHGVRAGQSR